MMLRAFVLLLTLFAPVYASSQAMDMAEIQVKLAEIQRSHIEGNVPDGDSFSTILNRDLNKFFSPSGKEVQVEYELLRKEPTQSGVALPKFYLWVVVSSEGKELKQGAMRVAAVEKRGFDVTNFLNRNSIQEDPSIVVGVFPKLLLGRIYELSGVKRDMLINKE
jgi:hypothetical protein